MSETNAIPEEGEFLDEFAGSPVAVIPEDPGPLDFIDSLQAHDFFMRLLEGPFLVPIRPGGKIPLCPWSKRPIESTHTEGYRGLFAASNIAVKLGKDSGNLVAIDFDIPRYYEEFLKDNPWATETLTVKSSRGFHVWIRLEGEYPASCKTAVLEWRGDKNLTTIYGTHESGWIYQYPVLAKPKVLRFSEIVWPDGWQIPGEESAIDGLQRIYGPIYMKTKNGVKLNQKVLACLYDTEFSVVFDNASNRFYRYNIETGCWEYQSEEDVEKAMGNYAAEKIGELREGNKEAPNELWDELLIGLNASSISALRRVLKAEVTKPAFGERQKFIHAQNCIVDMTQMPFVVKPFHKGWMSRYRCGVDYVEGATCPRFVNELLAPQLDEDDRFMLQMWVGQVLLGVNVAQVIMLMTGGGGTGKSTFARVLEAIVGRQNIYELRTKQLDGRFELGFYTDKSLLYGPDTNTEFLNNSGAHMLKALTGGDYLSGEIKGKTQAYTLKGNFNILLNSNNRLRLKMSGDQSAWRRRLLLLCFDKPAPTRKIPDFDKVLIAEEGPGILNWAIEGARMLLANLAEGSFPLSDSQKQRVENMIQESDSVRSFIANMIKSSPLPTDVVTLDKMYATYMDFCDKRAWECRYRGQFTSMAKDLMVELHRSQWSRKVRVTNGDGTAEDVEGWRGVNIVSPD